MDGIAHSLLWALLAVAAAWIYAWHVRRHPWMPCGKCSGSGKTKALSLDPFGHCGRCGGKGKRLRLAAWVLGFDLDSGRKKR